MTVALYVLTSIYHVQRIDLLLAMAERALGGHHRLWLLLLVHRALWRRIAVLRQVAVMMRILFICLFRHSRMNDVRSKAFSRRHDVSHRLAGLPVNISQPF